MQACWDAGHLRWDAFLHSPLMDELSALEERLTAEVGSTSFPEQQKAMHQLRASHPLQPCACHVQICYRSCLLEAGHGQSE